MHTNPIRKSGGYNPGTKNFTPSTDGGYDRISYSVAPEFGTDEQYKTMVQKAKKFDCLIAADIVPGHTGTGPDWVLSLMNHPDYKYLYHMVEIIEEDWDLLPFTDGKDTINLKPDVVEKLKEKGYIVGEVETSIFFADNEKDSNWSVTDEVLGVDGIVRRWVYLHVFKSGQPSLNWLHASFRAHQLLTGDILKSIFDLGAKIVRFDANSVLGVEKRDSGLAWNNKHPLSQVVTDQLAMFVRKVGGWSFEENMEAAPKDLKLNKNKGTDLSYDFITRAGFVYASISGDTSLLNLELEMLLLEELDPKMLIHSLQNHDSLFVIDPHLVEDQNYMYKGSLQSGQKIIDEVVENTDAISTELDFRTPGYYPLSTTFGTIFAARSGYISSKTSENFNKTKDLMLMASSFNIFLPGVFQISAWDLLGCLALDQDDPNIQELIGEADYRWLNRGGFNLMDSSVNGTGVTGVSKASTLFGDLVTQLDDEHSFVSNLKELLDIRKRYRIATSGLYAIMTNKFSFINTNVSCKNSVLSVLLQLPDLTNEYFMTIYNFGDEECKFEVSFDMFEGKSLELRDVQIEKTIDHLYDHILPYGFNLFHITVT
eukprot:TRINITY_DN550_c1_g3_i11.p1 TRINITY_DN550_c1_g3~~TRINITY_DN550_c1_g3_i11.p1  ORF type:complete len:597 (-),score=129.99 TRINITY_DN550_c1_g3_i11:432-2222(-)